MNAALPVRHQWRDALSFTTDPAVDAYAISVMNALHVHMDVDGRCKVGLRRLAGLARCTVATVRKRLGALVEAGWLAVEGADRERATYRAVIPASETAETPVDDRCGRPASVSPQRPGTPRSVSPGHTRTPTTMNPSGRAGARAPAGRGHPWRTRPGHDPSIGRPPPDRPPAEVSHLVERDDGTLWVRL